MTAQEYILASTLINLLGLISFYFVHLTYKKRQNLKCYAVMKRILSVRTKDEFEQVFRRLAGNEIKTLSRNQKEELLEVQQVLSANLI